MIIDRALVLVLGVLAVGCAGKDDFLGRVKIDPRNSGYVLVSEKRQSGYAIKDNSNHPLPSDGPPSRIMFFEASPPVDKSFGRPQVVFRDHTIVRFYDLREVGPDYTISASVRALRSAMKTRKTGNEIKREPKLELPDYPVKNAGYLLREKVTYHHYRWGGGCFFLVQYTQGPGNYPNNEELTYLFQGISSDGRIYVAADFRVSHPMLPATIRETPDLENIDDAAEAMAGKLGAQPDGSFAPELGEIRNFVGSFVLPQ